LPLRRHGEHRFPIQAWPLDIFTLDVARLDDLCGCRNRCGIQLAQHVDVLEQITELIAEPRDFFIGQLDARELRDVSDIYLIG
jgi:hypothetical protein